MDTPSYLGLRQIYQSILSFQLPSCTIYRFILICACLLQVLLLVTFIAAGTNTIPIQETLLFRLQLQIMGTRNVFFLFPSNIVWVLVRTAIVGQFNEYTQFMLLLRN